MDRFEFLLLRASPHPTQNARVSVDLIDGGTIPPRDVDLCEFQSGLAQFGLAIEIDEHPCDVVDLRIDVERRRVKIKARRRQSSTD